MAEIRNDEPAARSACAAAGRRPARGARPIAADDAMATTKHASSDDSTSAMPGAAAVWCRPAARRATSAAKVPIMKTSEWAKLISRSTP